MNEHIIAILKAVAQEHTEDYDGSLSCVFCSGNCDYRDKVDAIRHMADCPTILARTVLREMGTPLRAYQVTYDRIQPHFPVYTSMDNFRTGFTEDDVKALFQKPLFRYEKIQNVHITYVGDL